MAILITFACDNPSCPSKISFPMNRFDHAESPREVLEAEQWIYAQHHTDSERNLYICPKCAAAANLALTEYAKKANKNIKKLRIAYRVAKGVYYRRYNTKTKQIDNWQAPETGTMFALQPGKKISVIVVAKGKQ